MSEADTAAEKLVAQSIVTYKERGERAALRCALMDAATLCDARARDIEKANAIRGGRVSQVGQALAHAVRTTGDALMAMREKIHVG